MKHCLQLRSATGLGKGDKRQSAAFFGALLSLGGPTFSGCTQAPAPQNATPASATPDPGTDGLKEEMTRGSGVAPSKQPAASKNDSQDDQKVNQEAEPLQPISKTLPESFDCSGLSCYKFETSREALVPLLLHEKAQLIAFGEAHASASFRGTSTVHRFTHDLLPTISDGASHLLLELLNPPKEGCQKEKAAAQKKSDQVTEGQSKQNQNEYLTLGTESRKLGVVPDILWSTCEDLAYIASPEGGVVAMMETIAKLSEKSLKEQLRSTRKGRPLVLSYGGALHNDAVPREGRESWSYGPPMLLDTNGRYLEIDLIVPELISESESWKTFAWYDAYEKLQHEEGAVLMKWGEHSYSLFLEPGR